MLGLFTVAGFIEAGFWSQVNAFTPLFLHSLGLQDADIKSWTGYIATISAAVGLPLLPFWGALADRFSRQPIIVRSFVVHLLAAILALLAGNIWVFVLARSMGAFALGNSGLMMTTLSERTPPARVGLAFGIMNGSGPLGAFLGPLLGGPVVDAWGFSTLMAIDAALLLVVVAVMAFGYEDQYVGTDRGSLVRMAADSVGIILRSPRLRALFPALFLLFSGWMLAFTYVPIAIQALYKGPDIGTVTGWVLGAGGLVTLVVSPALGALGDRFGLWRTLFAIASLTVVLWPLPALAGTMMPNNLLAFTIAWAAINGVTAAVFALSFSVLANSAASEVRGRVMTFAYLPVNVGFAVGPAIGTIITRTSIFTVFPAAALMTLLGIGALVLAARQSVAPAIGSAEG
jgi:DHA1 family multidrug resistance protein-like MFS transporter